jgi:hypothetical protein
VFKLDSNYRRPLDIDGAPRGRSARRTRALRRARSRTDQPCPSLLHQADERIRGRRRTRALRDAGAPPLGTRLRLKASKDISGYPLEIRKIFQAMKTYGLIIADNGGNMYVTGTMDPEWDNSVLNPAFHSLYADDFEVIQLGWGRSLSQ